MKKILLFTSILFFAFSLSTVKAQTLNSVVTTTPIVCYGDFATVTAYMTQSTPAIPVQLVNYRVSGTWYFAYGSSGITTGATQPFAGMIGTCYRMFMVDSLAFVNNVLSLPSPLFQLELQNPTDPSILGYVDYCVDGVPELVITATQTAVNLCNGDCDASEKLAILGGTPPYSITINGITSVLGIGSIDTTYLNLCADTYDATIVDVNGCVSDPGVTSFTIAEPPLLIPNGSISSNYNGQDISCFGAADGEITGSVTGGTPPYTYSIDGVTFNPIPNNVFGGLDAGTHTIYYKDANGCDTLETITLTDPPDLSGALQINQQVSCNGVADGEIEFIVNNINTGTPSYQYSIDNGANWQNSNTFPGLLGGITYTIIIKDANDCESSASIFLSEPPEIIFSASSLDYNGFGVSCTGATDGQIVIQSPTGGTPTYQYSIDGGNNYSNQLIHNGLGAGTYVVRVKDLNNCTKDTTIIITEPLPFIISASAPSSYNGSDVSCYGICDGEVAVTQSNGVGAIIYTMTSYSPQTSPSWTGVCGGLSFGAYTIDATDANGCTANTTITLTEPQDWVYTVDSMPETCNLANGQASITVTQGGTAPLAYLWDDPLPQQITATATLLTTGLYEVRVTDINGCTFTEDVFVEEIDITLDFDSVPPCNGGNDGSATVIPDGIPPYTYQWFDNNGIIIPGATGPTLSGLAPGFYSVTVVDAGGAGCSATDTVEIPASAIVDVTLDVANSMLDVACFGYSSSGVTVIATGGTGPNTYLYHIPNFFPIPSASNIFSGLYAGTYPIYATDFNGCSDSVEVTITEPDQLVFTTLQEDISCNGGADGIAWIDTIYGGTQPYSYSWSTGAIIDSISNLIAGTYIVQVTDANGCVSDPTSDTIIIIEPPILQSAITIISHSNCAGPQTLATGEMTVAASGGASGYSYLWSNSSTSTSINFLMPGIYTVAITDDNGCTVSDTAEILSGENPTVAVVIQNVSCFGANDGWMFTSATGGTSPYSFSADGGVTFVPSGTPFGPSGPASYFITVVDNLNCWDTASVSVTEPDLLQVASINIQNVSCYDSANGELEVIVIGGTPGYSYLWDDPLSQTTQTATNLVPGTYTVTVTDTNNCPPAVSFPVAITQPDSLYISDLTFTAVVCNGDSTGTATVVAAGGTPNYSYAWSSGSLLDVAPNLIAGTYTIQISDINGCSRNSSIVVTEPNALSATFIRDSVSCLGGSDGWAKVIVNGGVVSYTYLWDNGSDADTAGNLDAGYHTVTITDNNLCVLIDSINILEPSLSVTIDSLIISEITCHDADNASITVLATGGHLPYAYSNTNGFNTQSAIGFSNLGPNTYIMYVEDDYGCIDRDTVEIINPDSLYIDTVVFSNVSCYGWGNGSIQAISAFGGVAPYMYAVNGGAHHANMAYFNGYGPGAYTVEVFDVNNCGAQDIITITQPDELDVTITTSNWNSYQIKCNGDASGFADIIVNGGAAPYTYTALDASGATFVSSFNPNISGLTAGTYTFVITDANSCSYSETIIYNEPPPIIHTFIATHVSCSGWNNGSLTDVVSGGVGTATTYNYSWNTGATTYSLTSIPIGIYTMTVVDENNCTSIDSYTINDNNALNVTATGTDVSCYDYCDGIIVTNVTGGMPNINSSGLPVYSYQWDDILLQNTENAIGLCVDNTSNSTTYSCVVTDGQGCTDTVEYILNQPDSLHVTASILNGISCNLDNDGKLTAAVTGGNGGTTYLWNNWTSWNGNPINNTLSVGSYVVVAKDVNGCMDTTEIYLPEPSALSIVISSEIDVSCFGFGDGTITADADGGTPINGIPPKYNYTWSNSFNEQIDISTATGLIPGIYTVTAEDANGCTITSESVYITGPSNPLSILVDSTDETCALNDGSATAFVLGGTLPYAYAWSNGGTTNPQVNLAPGLYTVDVTDANGCTISDETFVNGVQNIFLPGNLSSIDSTVCLGATIFLEIEEKPNLNYVWEDGSIIVDRWVTPKDPVNVYILSITDPNCAIAYTVTATINVEFEDPFPGTNPGPVNGPYATIIQGESIEIFSDNMNCDIYEWSWRGVDPDDTTRVQLDAQRVIIDNPDASGWYRIAVVTPAGCEGVDSIYVVVGVGEPALYDAITPNGDGKNDVWNILNIDSYPNAVIQIFNRWGALVHETSGGSNYIPWDGTREGKELPVGTYYYIIDLNTGDEPQTGPITIIR